MNTSALVDLAGTGATAVLYLLFALSAIQLAVIVERGIVMWRTRAPKQLRARVRAVLDSGPKTFLAVATTRSLEGRVLAAGAANADRGPDAAQEMMRSTLIDTRLEMERGLAFLGTLGNNAPFLGLFGTVLGVIHATQDLSTAAGRASSSVMAGISEALISTAVGLLVALPAVVAYNYFQRTLKTRSISAESLAGELIAHMKSPSVGVRKAA
jgi:biopolymer transport protein ExbB